MRKGEQKNKNIGKVAFMVSLGGQGFSVFIVKEILNKVLSNKIIRRFIVMMIVFICFMFLGIDGTVFAEDTENITINEGGHRIDENGEFVEGEDGEYFRWVDWVSITSFCLLLTYFMTVGCDFEYPKGFFHP